MTIVPLTTLSGDEYSPAFSPDGEHIAFSWNGENEDNFDLYIKLVGSAAVRRLTTHPDFDADPSWSPDGKQIAFIRWRMSGGCRVYVLSLLGGSEQKLGEFAVSEADPARYSSIAWSPDADYVAAAGTPMSQPGTRAVGGILSASGESRRPPASRPGRERHGALQSCIFARRPSPGLRFVQGTGYVRRIRRRS